MSRFPGSALRNGHVGIGVNNDRTQGFYPVKPGDMFGPGVVKNDDMNELHDTLRIPTSPEQDAAVQAYMDARRTNPGNYNLLNRQCTDYVSGALRAGNVKIPSTITNTRVNQMSPNRFFPLLRNWYER
jgi:hypothetical protein